MVLLICERVNKFVACSIKKVRKREILSVGDRLLIGNGYDVSLILWTVVRAH
jgi:hypothetical protein